MILRYPKLEEQLITNKYARVVFQSTTTEEINKSKEANVPQIPFQYLLLFFLQKIYRKSNRRRIVRLLQTVKRNGQRKKPNKKEEENRQKTLNRTELPTKFCNDSEDEDEKQTMVRIQQPEKNH